MSDSDLKILITGSLNIGKSIGEINTAIKSIEQKINKLKLNVEINDKTTQTLQNFSKAMEKMKLMQQDLQRSYKEEEVVVKRLDGSVEKTTKQYLKNGEIIEKTRKTIDEKTKSIEKETEALGRLSSELDDVIGKQQKLITRKDGKGNLTGTTEKFSNGITDTTVNFNKDGNETSRTIVENLDKEEKLTKQLTKAKEELIQKVRILNRENKIDNETANAVTDLTKNTYDIEKIKQYNNSLQDVTSLQKIQNKEIQEKIKLQEQDRKKAIEVEERWQKNLKQRDSGFIDQQKSLRNELVTLASQGKITKEELKNLAKGINTSEFENQLNKIGDKIDRVRKSHKILQTEVANKGTNVFKGDALGNFDNFKKLSSESRKHLEETLKLQDAYKGLKVISTQVDQVNGKWSASIKDTGGKIRDLKGVIDVANGTLYKHSEAIKDATGKHMGMMSQMTVAFQRIPIWMLGMTAFYAPLRGLQSAVSEILLVDKAMTELKRVMDATPMQYNSMLEQSIQLSKDLGNNVHDVLKSLNEVARSFGDTMTQQEMMDMTKTAILASNVSDLTADEAMKNLIGTMNAFKIVASESIQIVDKMNEVDNNYAISTKQISEAMSKSSAVAKVYGVTIDELIGHITAIGSVTMESGSIIGRSLKTLYSRITTLDKSKEALEAIGISIYDMSGNIKPANTLIQEMADKWSSLTDEQRQNTAINVAGRDQLTRLVALLENYSTAVKATNTSLTSQGSATAENQKYLESYESRLNQLSTSWTQLSLTLGDAMLNDTLFGLIELLKGLTSVSSGAVKAIGFLPIVLGVLGSTLFLVSANFRKAVVSVSMYKAALQGLTISANTAKIAIRGLLASIGVGIAFAAIGFGIEKLISKFTEAKQNADELKKSLNTSMSSITTDPNKVQELITKFKELEKIKSSQGKLSTTQEEEYLRINNELAQLLPTIIQGTDAKGNAILANTAHIEKEIELLKERAELEREKLIKEAPDKSAELDAERKKIEMRKKTIQDDIAYEQATMDRQKNLENKEETYKRILALRGQLNDIELELNNNSAKQQEHQESILAIYNQINNDDKKILFEIADVSEMDTLAQKFNDIRKMTGDLFNSKQIKLMDEQQVLVLTNMSTALKNGFKDFKVFDEVLRSSGFTNASKVVEYFTQKQVELTNAVNQGSLKIDENGNIVDATTGKIIEIADEMGNLGEKVDEVSKKYDDALSTIQTLNGFLDELNEHHKLSADSISTVIAEYPELLAYMNDEVALSEQIKLKLKEQEDKAKEVIYNKIKDNETYFNTILKANNDYFRNLADYYGIDLEKFKSLAQAKELVESTLINKLSDKWSKYYDVAKQAVTAQGFGLQHGVVDGKYDPLKAYSMNADMNKDINAYKKEIDGLSEKFKNIAVNSSGVDFKNINLDKPKDKKSKSNKDKPNNKETIDALIRQYNLQQELTSLDSEKIKKQLDLAKSQSDYNTQLELTNKLTQNEQKRISELSQVQSLLHKQANTIRNSNKQYDTSNWFDKDNEESINFINQYNKATKSQQEKMMEVFTTLQKLKKAYGDSSSEIIKLREQVVSLNDDYNTLNLEHLADKFTNSLSRLDYHMQLSKDNMSLLSNENEKFTDGLIRQNAVLQQKVELTDTEIDRLVKLLSTMKGGTKEYQDTEKAIRDLILQVNQYNKELLDLQRTAQDHARKKLDAISSTEQKVVEMIKHRVQVEKDTLRESLTAYEKYINDKINVLRKEADTDDYNKQLAKEQEELMKLQQLQNEWMMNNSLEGRNMQRKLTGEIAAQEEKIIEMQRKKSLDGQIDNLQQLIESERERTEEKENELDKQLENDKIYAEARKAIETGYLRWLVRETDGSYRQVNGIVQTTMADLKLAYTDFENVYGQGLSALGDQIKNEFIDKIITAQDEIKNLVELMKQVNMDVGDFTPVGSTTRNQNSSNLSNDNLNLMLAKFINDQMMTNQSIQGVNGSIPALQNMRNSVAGSISDRSKTVDPNNTQNFNQIFGNLSANQREQVIEYLRRMLLNGQINNSSNAKTVDSLLKNLPMFETGGMLGKWSDGKARLAGLHPEELILSKTDTSKFKDLMEKLSQAHKNVIHNLTPVSPSFGGVVNKQQPIELNIGSLIGNVEGNLDRTVLPDIQRMIDDSFGKFARQFNKIGISKRV